MESLPSIKLMNNPFQEQLLKAGVVSKKQVDKVNQQKKKQNKQQRSNKKLNFVNEAAKKAKQKANLKAQKDIELNQKKQLQAKQKAQSIEIDKFISDNKLKRDNSCEVSYQFQHRNKVNMLYVNEDMKQKIVAGKLGIARIQGRYELVPKDIADKIVTRNDKRIVLFSDAQDKTSEPNDYADYEIPDDLMW